MTAHVGPGWVLAASLIVLENEANAMAPERSKISDGSIGDPAHAARTSAHNPRSSRDGGHVRALDLTHDPAGGFDAVAVANRIADRCIAGTERRVKGIGSYNYATNSERWFAQRGIWPFRKWSWKDQDLNGATHRTHMHLEVLDTPNAWNDTTPWGIAAPATPTQPKEPRKVEHLFKTADNPAVYWFTGVLLIPMGSSADIKAVNDSRIAQGLAPLVTQVVRQAFLDRLE